MTKKIITPFIFWILFISGGSFAQTGSIGIGTSTPDKSAILHLESFNGAPATATATVTGGAVTAVTVTNGGKGYTTAPTINFYGGGAILSGGSKAKATATITNGVVTAINLTNGGNGYTSVPTVAISGGNKGLLFPHLNIADLSDVSSPVANPADGLLVYNSGSNSNKNTLHFFNSTLGRWQSGLYAEDTPKVAYLNFTGSLSLLDNSAAGDYGQLLQNNLSLSPVSNIDGLKVMPRPLPTSSSPYYLIFPQGKYIVEVNLKLNAPPANPSTQGTPLEQGGITSDYYLMGYFIDFYQPNYNNSTGTFFGTTPPLTRKEIPLISKVNTNHFASLSYYLDVPYNADPNIVKAMNMSLGRMSGTTFYDLVNIIPDGSYIRITKL